MPNLTGDSSKVEVSGVHGINSASGIGVLGDSSKADGVGVFGQSDEGIGVKGLSHGQFRNAVVGVNDFSGAGPGRGGNGGNFESAEGEGVRGTCKNAIHAGVVGKNTAGGIAVFGESLPADGIGVFGQSDEGIGVKGLSHGQFRNAVVGVNDFSGAGPGRGGNGGNFESAEGEGVRGTCKNAIHAGVVGKNSAGGIAVFGESLQVGGVGVHARGARLAGFFEGDVEVTSGLRAHAVVASNHESNATGAAIFAEKKGDNGHAGFFAGNVHVTRNLTVDGDMFCDAGDCAEDFDIADADQSEPGTVMVLGDDGTLSPSQSAYDKRVVGVVSGAGHYRPAIVLDKQQRSSADRKPIALLGKVFCKVDASSAQIDVGDLLTTSNVPGHAMKAVEPATAFGAVIGKALRPLAAGQGLIPILVTLQ